MTPLDLAVVVAYLVATLGTGLWRARGQATAGDYFLGARDLPAWAVLLSIVATETSALTVISVPGIGARGNLTFLQVALGYLVGRVVTAAWLLPGYFAGSQETAYERIERRFGVATRRTLSLLFLVTRFLGDGVRIFAGAIPLALLTGWSLPTSIWVLSLVTIAYTWAGGLAAVVWADVLQLAVYVAGGIAALGVAVSLAGGPSAALARAGAEGSLRLLELRPSLEIPYTLLGGLVGGAFLSAASHGTDHLIVQRLLATRSLGDAQRALVGSGFVVLLQFTLFLLIGVAIRAAGLAPAGVAADELFPRFITTQLPPGLGGLLAAAILAAAMSTQSSAINALASSLTHDWYASLTGERDPARLLRVGRLVSLGWGLGLTLCALAFGAGEGRRDTPVVVLALSIASVTYGALLGAYVLAGLGARVRGPHVVTGAACSVLVMLAVVFARPLAALPGLGRLAPLARLAWPWYVVLGTGVTVGTGWLLSRLAAAPEDA
ncbi:MAG: sodium:solute symporter [Gemmatimonadales bacterium]|nr:sodium:solute symporter [Gemmatimonadales bacterium]